MCLTSILLHILNQSEKLQDKWALAGLSLRGKNAFVMPT